MAQKSRRTPRTAAPRIKNTGVSAQKDFEERFDALGKLAYVIRLDDQKDLTALNGKVVKSNATTSDNIVVMNGRTFFAEVKSSHGKVSFPLSSLRKTQIGYAKAILAAGGEYYVYVKNMLTGEWFEIHARNLVDWLADGKKSVKWSYLRLANQWNL